MNAQQLIMGHLLPVTAAIVVLWIAYRLLFGNGNRLQFNRIFLLSSMLFALALPLIGTLVGHGTPEVVTMRQNLFKGFMLNEITITVNGVAETAEMETAPPTAPQLHISVWQVFGYIFIIGAAVMTLLLLIKLVKLAVMTVRSPKEKCDGYTLVFTGREQGSFSFLGYVFLPDKNASPDIVRHELSHIGHHHSWDILFVEIMKIVQWFNPVIYLYKKELQSLHEYQADRDVVSTGVDKRDYMMLILQQCTAVDFSGISNNFSLILTKKRIKMITRNEKAKGLWWRLLATVPVLAILVIANAKVSAQQVAKTDNPVYENNASGADDINADTHIKPDELFRTDNDSVFNIVEKMPEFPGGTEAMMKYVAQNVKYPEEAKEKGISGRVFVSFVIEKDGSVSNVEVLRGIGGGCDEEAVRVVKSMPKWTPGMQKGKPVRVNYNMPFFFKLDDSVKKANTNSLVGTIWEGTGTGTKKGVTYTWHSIMQFNSENEGLFIEKLTSQKRNGKTVVEFENVAMDFEYSFDGKKTGAITPKNADGTYMDDLPPEGVVLSDDGKTIVFNFYTATEETGIQYVTYTKR